MGRRRRGRKAQRRERTVEGWHGARSDKTTWRIEEQREGDRERERHSSEMIPTSGCREDEDPAGAKEVREGVVEEVAAAMESMEDEAAAAAALPPAADDETADEAAADDETADEEDG